MGVWYPIMPKTRANKSALGDEQGFLSKGFRFAHDSFTLYGLRNGIVPVNL